MHAAAITTALPATLGSAAIVLTLIGVMNALVRLVLCGLAAYATRKALCQTGTEQDGDRIRAHRLAVLQAILTALTRRVPTGRTSAELSSSMAGSARRLTGRADLTRTTPPVAAGAGARLGSARGTKQVPL
jgi:hypothetical protein